MVRLQSSRWLAGLHSRAIAALLLCLTLSAAHGSLTPVGVDFGRWQDVPLLKKFAIYNSGIVPQARYTKDVIASMGMIKAASLRIDLSIGKHDTGFTKLVSGTLQNVDFQFDLIDTLAEGLQSQKVMPYWGLSYNPFPFQPVCEGGAGSAECINSTATCRGFEDQAAVPGTNNYTCRPYGSAILDDCWKCPPKTPQDNSYADWGQMVAVFHDHFLGKNITPLYEEHWNEPDLTEYYNPTLAAYKGTSADYIDSYVSCADSLLNTDADLVFGGLSVANQILHNPRYPKQPNNEDTLLALADNDRPMDFFTFHSITTTPGMDQIKLMIDRAQLSREVLASPALLNITGEWNRFDTTEVHCNEFYPNSTTETLTTAFSGSPYLATILLETWNLMLAETDLTMVHWAQYMDVFNTSDQIGLIDFWGHPRPAWWAFKWYAELPVERVALEVKSPYVRGLAGFSDRDCTAAILLWNVPHPSNGRPQADTTLLLTLSNVPFPAFRVEAYVIDDRRHPNGGYEYNPAAVFKHQRPQPNGTYSFPPPGFDGLRLPVNGTILLQLLPEVSACRPQGNAANRYPAVQTLRTHHYFGFRPFKTSSYAHFHQRDWSAYLGMGEEAQGLLVTGVTARAGREITFNITMELLDGIIQAGGIYGVRVDFSCATSSGPGYRQPASYFIYQNGTKPCALSSRAEKESKSSAPSEVQSLDLSAGLSPSPPESPAGQGGSSTSGIVFANQNGLSSQPTGRRLLRETLLVCGLDEDDYVQIPPLWGTEQGVLPDNFIPTDLSSFTLATEQLAPIDWDGRILLLFVLKDATPETKLRVHVTEQPSA